jgi:hypothetical protein
MNRMELAPLVEALQYGYLPEDLEYWMHLERDKHAQDPIPVSMLVFQELRKFGMYGAVDKVWSRKLAAHLRGKRVLEVMSGAGWLAKGLAQEGIFMIATDNYDKEFDQQGTVFAVEHLDAINAVTRYRQTADVLLVSWPPYQDEEICRVCKAWGEKPIIYIGEWEGGCTACDEFFAFFHVDYEIEGLPQLPAIHDHCWIGYYSEERKKMD